MHFVLGSCTNLKFIEVSYGISTIVGYLIPDPLYTYTLNIYGLVWFGFMAYQSLYVI